MTLPSDLSVPDFQLKNEEEPNITAHLFNNNKISKNVLHEKSGEWDVSRKRTRKTEQRDKVEEQDRRQKCGIK